MSDPEQSASSPSTDFRADSHFTDRANDVGALQAEVAELRQAMDSRAVIEQAKGIVMCRYGIGADAAFQLLRRRSSVINVKVRIVAQLIVDEVAHGAAAGGAARARLDTAVLAMLDAPARAAGDQSDDHAAGGDVDAQNRSGTR